MTRSHRVRPRQFFTRLLVAGVVVTGLTSIPVRSQSAQDDREFSDLWTSNDTPFDVDWSDRVPAYVAAVDGDAWLEREGQTDRAEENVPLIAGDRLWTERGRLEVLFADGTSLALDEYSDLDLLSDRLARLESGRILLTVARTAAANNYRVDAAGTTTWIRAAGEYSVTATPAGDRDGDVQVLVLRGLAEISSPFGRSLVRAGYEASASARTVPTLPYAVTVSSWDAFSRWTDNQQAYRHNQASTSYLPEELRYYGGLFDRQGSWRYEPVVGYVWYPHVDAGWRPYSVGRWSVVGSFGWTWIGHDRWSWPTHHYGRWGLAGSRWYWIPGRRWAPAWVSWASAPSYVGWSPLGYNNRPVIDININIGQTWRAWSIAPTRSFYAGVVVASRDVIRPADVGRGFVLRSAPPRYAIGPRGIGPSQRGSTAVQRDSRIAAPSPRDREAAPRSSLVPSPRARTEAQRPPAASRAPRSTTEREAPPPQGPSSARADRNPSRSVVMPGPVGRPSQRVYSEPTTRDDAPRASAAPRSRIRPVPPSPSEAESPRDRQPGRTPRAAIDRDPAPRSSTPPEPRNQEPRTPARQRASENPGASRSPDTPARQAPAPPASSGGGRAQPRRGR